MKSRAFVLASTLLFTTVPVARAGSPATRPAAAVPSRAVPLATNGVPLDTFLDSLRDAGLNLAINWPALEAAGVDRAAMVDLRLRGVPIRTALDYALRQAGNGSLAWYVADGVVHVTTRDLADRAVVTRVFPVQDLIVEVPDFKMPPVTLTGGTGGRGGGGGGSSMFGSSGEANPEGTQSREERGEKLAELIRTLVRPEVWVGNGGTASVRYFNGNLIVTAPRDVIAMIGK